MALLVIHELGSITSSNRKVYKTEGFYGQKESGTRKLKE